MRVLVTGASGLVGTAVVAALRKRGDQAIALVRRPTQRADERQWNPSAVDPRPFENADAVVHLAGENIASGRWTEKRKQQILSSRVDATRNLSQSIAAVSPKPKVLVSASAIGFYGSRGDDVLNEQASSGTGFLAQVAREWEGASEDASRAGIRVVLLRIGVVLARSGGALPKMALPFRFGAGGRVGTGRQWMSWIELDDLVRLIMFALDTESLRGPVNAVGPQPVTNAEFTRSLARVLHRPALFPAPAFALRLTMGEMADELLLSSQRVAPKAAMEAGFRFQYAQLETALRHVFSEH